MLTLIGSLLGFGTSFLPRILDFFQDKSDKAHELLMLAAQTEAQAKLETVRLEGVRIEADIREVEALHKEQASTISKGGAFLAWLSGSLRPVVTYLFVAEYLAITWAIAWLVVEAEGINVETLRSLLDDEFMGLLSSMLAFWFGNRTFGKRKT